MFLEYKPFHPEWECVFFVLPAWVYTQGVHPSGQTKKHILDSGWNGSPFFSYFGGLIPKLMDTILERFVFLCCPLGCIPKVSTQAGKQKNTFFFLMMKWLHVFPFFHSYSMLCYFARRLSKRGACSILDTPPLTTSLPFPLHKGGLIQQQWRNFGWWPLFI